MTSRGPFTEMRRELAARQATIAPVFARELKRRLVQAAPKKSLRLARSIDVYVDRPLSRSAPVDQVRLVAEATAKHASYTNDGTRPHDIVGNPILAFFWEKVGRFVYFHRVRHPGTTGTKWWTTTMAETSDLLRDLWRRL